VCSICYNLKQLRALQCRLSPRLTKPGTVQIEGHWHSTKRAPLVPMRKKLKLRRLDGRSHTRIFGYCLVCRFSVVT
jgi:hypothetical protein